MARADSSPKAIVKAAIRTKCHVVARRYEHQRLEKLHGSNVKWLVLSDELFEEVFSDFTIRKLDISRAAKRSLFDAEWVSQVTYELITKPARPRRGRQHTGGDDLSSQSRDSVTELDAMHASRAMHHPLDTSSSQHPSSSHRRQISEGAPHSMRHDSIVCLDPSLLPTGHRKSTPTTPESSTASRSGWFDTILN